MPLRRARFHFDTVYEDRRLIGPYALLQVGDLYCEQGYTILPHVQRVHELTYVVSGAGKTLTGGTTYPMEPGTLFYNRRGEEHAITASDSLRFFYLGFDFPTPDGALREFYETLTGCRVSHAEAVGDAFIRMFGEIGAHDLAAGTLLESAMQEVVGTACRLLGRVDTAPYRAVDARAVDERLVYDLVHYLDAHAADPDTLASLPREFGYSYTHLASKFREIIGENLREYHTRRRFERARELLRRGESVTQTAELTGYQSIHAFSRAFRRVTGEAPRTYRQRFTE